jgi:hypothetical protein
MTVRLHIAVQVVLYFIYIFLHNKCAVVLTSIVRTHGHSHTKDSLPLSFLAVWTNRFTQGEEPETAFE